MGLMQCVQLPIAGAWAVHTQPRGDERGRLTRVFCEHDLTIIRPGLRFVQTNLSRTCLRGTVRGLHFQREPALEAKLIRCLRGEAWDVMVDLRAESPTFGKWHAVLLSSDNECQVFIPEGCAHGFQALTDDVELLYQHTAAYSPTHEAGVRHDDPMLGIAWPLPITVVSERDRQHPRMSDDFQKVIT
jgi:dTDP-4-dehydrorhamnose 3,5-epimerase